MSEYYYGKIGKDESWGLLADKRIVVWSKQTGEFHAFDSIKEADEHYVNPGEDEAYFWDAGQWNHVDFLLQGGAGKSIKGFAPGGS